MADIENPDLFVCGSRTWISLDIASFYEEHCQPSNGSAWPSCPKNGNRAPIARGGRGRHNLHSVCQTAVTAPPRVCCVVWSLLYSRVSFLSVFWLTLSLLYSRVSFISVFCLILYLLYSRVSFLSVFCLILWLLYSRVSFLSVFC